MKMTHGIGATIILVWFIILVVRPSSASAIEVIKEQVVHLGDFPTETCDLTGSGQQLARNYSQFLVRLRNRMNATMSCNIPVTRSNLPAGSEYVLVELKVGSGTRSVTLALQVNNLYVIAYRVGGQTSGVFFNEANVRDAMSKLFSKSATQRTLPYDGSYPALSGAGANRKNVDLGLLELKKRVEAFFQGTVTAVEEAKFLVVAIQLVAEATRFKYVESLVVRQGLTKSFKPDDEMLDYENNWGKISKAVHKSQKQEPNQCVTIRPSIVIGKKTLTLVSDIRIDVGILMYDNNEANNGHQMFSQIVASSFSHIAVDVGDLEIAF